MSETEMEGVLDRIRKLLRLAGNNSNANEAALAAARANELMLRYKLDSVSLDVDAPGEAVRSYMENEPIFSARNLVSWKNRLASTLATHNACKIIHCPIRDWSGKKQTQVRIIGTKSNAQVVGYLYAYISREIERLASQGGRGMGKSWANDFKHGAVLGVGEKLREMKAKVAAEYTGAALMVLDKEAAALAKFYESISRRFVKSHAGQGGFRSAAGLEAGREAGRNISVNRGISGAGSRKSLVG